MNAIRAAMVALLAGALSLSVSTAWADGGAVPVKKEGAVAVAKNKPSDVDEPDPQWAFGAALMVGADVISERGPYDRELERFEHAPLPDRALELGGRFSAFYEGFELSLVPSVALTPEQRDQGLTYVRATRVFTDFTYDLWRSQIFTIGPTLGFGWMHSDVCFPGEEGAPASTAGPLFRQVVANPGAGACLTSTSWSLRGGGVIGFVVPTPMRIGDATMFVNARPMIEWPIQVSPYSREGSSLPSFDGPTAPHPSFTLMVELGVLYGAGAR